MHKKEGDNMKDAFEKLFRAVHQFKKLNVSDLVPGLSSSEFSVMGAYFAKWEENGKITKLQSWRRRPKHFRRLCRAHCADWKKKGYVERSVDKKRPQKYVYQSDREGLEKGGRGTGQNAGLWLLCDVTVKGRGYRSAG